MNDDIIRMAREAGFLPNANPVMPQLLARFAALVRADEREACAQVCEGKAETDTRFWYDYRRGALNCAAAIRARSK